MCKCCWCEANDWFDGCPIKEKSEIVELVKTIYDSSDTTTKTVKRMYQKGLLKILGFNAAVVKDDTKIK